MIEKAGHSRVCETGRQSDQIEEDGRGCFAAADGGKEKPRLKLEFEA
jgi:hypothetical protein